MYKRLIISFTAFLFVFLCGCNDLGIGDALALDEDQHIHFTNLDNDRIVYQGVEYYPSPVDFLWSEGWKCESTEEYKYLGWAGSRFLSPSHWYADSFESPIFIYANDASSGITYLREDFDYEVETYVIEGTSETIVFGNELEQCDLDVQLFGKPTERIVLSSTVCSPLKLRLYTFSEKGHWYVYTGNLKIFKLSERFYNILDENNLLT